MIKSISTSIKHTTILACLIAASSVYSTQSADDTRSAAIKERIAPVGQVALTSAPASPQAAAETASTDQSGQATESNTILGKKIYGSRCAACHTTGIAGAPKIGDKPAWQARLSQGIDTLKEHATKGFNAMPPKGTCPQCSDDEINAAVDYMIQEST